MSDSVQPHRWQPTRLRLVGKNSSRQEHWSGLPFLPPIHESEKWKWSHSVMSDSSWPHGLQPTRLLPPWDFPGKSTGVGCHCLLWETPGLTGKFGLGIRNEAGQRLIEFCQENTLVIHNKHSLPTTQEKTPHMDITRWSTLKSDWLYSLQPKMEKLYTVSKNKTWSWLWLRSWTPYCQIET